MTLYTGLNQEGRCDAVFLAYLGMEPVDLAQFLRLGLARVERELHLDSAVVSSVPPSALDAAKTMLRLRALHGAGPEFERLSSEVVAREPSQSLSIDPSGYPVLSAKVAGYSSGAMSGSEPIARRLMKIGTEESARFDFTGFYRLGIDPPRFRHLVVFDLFGYAGSPGLLPRNLRRRDLLVDGVLEWQSNFQRAVEQDYNAVLHQASDNFDALGFGAGTRARFDRVRREESETTMKLGEICTR